MKMFGFLKGPLISIKRLKISYFDQEAKVKPFQKMDAMKKVRSGIDRMFEKSLQDLVRLVRINKHREKKFIDHHFSPVFKSFKVFKHRSKF